MRSCASTAHLSTATVIPGPQEKPSATTPLALAMLANAAVAAPRATTGSNETGSTAAITAESAQVAAAVVGGTKNKSNKIPPKQLFVLIRILFQYLEKVDVETLQFARKVRVDCDIVLHVHVS